MATALLIGLEPSDLLPEGQQQLSELTLANAVGADDVAEHFLHHGAAIEAIVIGPCEENAVALAQHVYSLDHDVAILILAATDRLAALRANLTFTPFIGRQTRCGSLELRDAACQELLSAVADTRARRAHRQTMQALSSKLASAAVPRPRAINVLDRLLELAPVGVLSLRNGGDIEVANQAAKEMLGIESGTEPGSFIGAFHPDTSKVEAFLRRAAEVGVPQTVQLERNAEENRQFFSATATSLEEGGLLVILQEITERVRAEREHDELLRKLEAAIRMRDDFLSVASHELRTPLASIMGWIALMRSGRLAPEKHARALETIERNAKAQAQLIEDLLDVSRIVSGKVRLDVTSVSLEDIVRQAIESVGPAAEAKGIRLEVLIDPHIGLVMGDSHRLQQVVWNLLTNAVKFTPKEGRISVTLHRAGSSAEIVVRDSGVGIDEEFLSIIFERFRQADMGTTRSHGGLGLGLSIVRHFVELHGGTVQAESAGKGHGSTFKVRLPLSAFNLPAQMPNTAEEQRREFQCPPRLAGVRVLVVEDEPSVRELMATLLTNCELKVVAVGSAEEGLRELEREIPDAIISDIGMPGQDGFEFLRKVRALPEARGGKVPAVAITAYAGAEDRRKALLAGFQMHVPKPVSPEDLLLVLASLTGRM